MYWSPFKQYNTAIENFLLKLPPCEVCIDLHQLYDVTPVSRLRPVFKTLPWKNEHNFDQSLNLIRCRSVKWLNTFPSNLSVTGVTVSCQVIMAVGCSTCNRILADVRWQILMFIWNVIVQYLFYLSSPSCHIGLHCCNLYTCRGRKAYGDISDIREK